MMLGLLTAARFEKVKGSGRTQPCLLVCENEAGEEVEVVAKLRGHPQIMPGGLLAEAVASLLALEANDEGRMNESIHSVPMEWTDDDGRKD